MFTAFRFCLPLFALARRSMMLVLLFAALVVYKKGSAAVDFVLFPLPLPRPPATPFGLPLFGLEDASGVDFVQSSSSKSS